MIVTHKYADLVNEGLFLKSLVMFLEEPMFFFVAFEWNFYEQAFPCVMTKITFAVKFVERSNRLFSVYLTNHLVWNICTHWIIKLWS